MRARRTVRFLAAAAVAAWGSPSPLAGQDLERCDPANRFMTGELSLVTRIDPDTLNDWRTHRTLPACRITAAGARRASLRIAARIFYDRLRDAGWTHTPDPRDAPNESSLRMRYGDTDCLFNVYQGILIGTDAEIEVSNAVETQPGEALYHVLVQCVPAVDLPPMG